jgi:hypothetical protein
MIVAVHQPNFLPRVKVLQKLAFADLWVVLDDVQFARHDYQNRTYLCPDVPSQIPRWCSLSVNLEQGRATKIKDVRLAQNDCLTSVRNVLQASFRRVDLVDDVITALSAQLDDSSPLVSLGIAGTCHLLSMSGRVPKIVLASSLRTEAFAKSYGILQLCQAVGATTYVADSGATNYLDPQLLTNQDIDVIWQVWQPPLLDLPHDQLRNGSSVNVWMRDPDRFGNLLAICPVTRDSRLVTPDARSTYE